MSRNKERGSRKTSTSFSLRAEGAEAVCLAGTFNGWNPTATPMKQQSDGEWQLELELAPGGYEYKFVVDGRWCCDASCKDHDSGSLPDVVSNSFGTWNRVIEVG